MTTSPPLQQTDLFGTVLDFPGSSSAHRPAKTSAAPTPKARASTASEAGSISKLSDLSMNAGLIGTLLRTALISELEAQTASSLRWRASDTPAGHLWSVLETSAPITSANDPGSLDSMLATPRKSDGERGGRGDVLSQLRGYPSKHAGMPTPRASDMKADGSGDTGRMGTVRYQLHQALETLPTPTKRDKRLDSWSPAYDRRKSPTMDAVMSGAMMSLTPTAKGNLTAPSMAKWAGARALAQLLQSHGLSGTAALPVTYGWMMGYPAGWLSRALRSAVQGGQLQLASSSKRSATR